MLMGITAEAVVRTGQILSDGLQFSVTHVAYGTGGFDPLDPGTPSPLDPDATALVSELFRKEVPPGNTINNELYFPRGKETTYVTVGGIEFTGIIGEAGLFATVTAPGISGLSVGYRFLLAQAHFGRIVFTFTDRLSLSFPISYYSTPVAVASYDESTLTYDGPVSYSGS
jgi:hypothetical protein